MAEAAAEAARPRRLPDTPRRLPAPDKAVSSQMSAERPPEMVAAQPRPRGRQRRKHISERPRPLDGVSERQCLQQGSGAWIQRVEKRRQFLVEYKSKHNVPERLRPLTPDPENTSKRVWDKQVHVWKQLRAAATEAAA